MKMNQLIFSRSNNSCAKTFTLHSELLWNKLQIAIMLSFSETVKKKQKNISTDNDVWLSSQHCVSL